MVCNDLVTLTCWRIIRSEFFDLSSHDVRFDDDEEFIQGVLRLLLLLLFWFVDAEDAVLDISSRE